MSLLNLYRKILNIFLFQLQLVLNDSLPRGLMNLGMDKFVLKDRKSYKSKLLHKIP